MLRTLTIGKGRKSLAKVDGEVNLTYSCHSNPSTSQLCHNGVLIDINHFLDLLLSQIMSIQLQVDLSGQSARLERLSRINAVQDFQSGLVILGGHINVCDNEKNQWIGDVQ